MTAQQAIGAVLNGRYRILRVLGQGGVGTVYLAEHMELQIRVALKEVRGSSLDEPEYQEALEQCRREGRLLVNLDHPNLPKVTDAFIEGPSFYLVRDYVEGVTAEDRLRAPSEQPLNVQQVIEWGIQIARVLRYLHSQAPPVIFRDLKPDNIIVQPDGTVKLVDFGIARRFIVGAQSDTMRLGSLGYSPPEQFGLKQTDQRSDLYSLGATLHHLLTGYDSTRQPFRLPPAAQLNPDVPIALSNLLDRCLELDPSRRPANAQEVLKALLSIRDSGVVLTGVVSLSGGDAYSQDPLDDDVHQAVVCTQEPTSTANSSVGAEPQERSDADSDSGSASIAARRASPGQPSSTETSANIPQSQPLHASPVLSRGRIVVVLSALALCMAIVYMVGKVRPAIRSGGDHTAQIGNGIATPARSSTPLPRAVPGSGATSDSVSSPSPGKAAGAKPLISHSPARGAAHSVQGASLQHLKTRTPEHLNARTPERLNAQRPGRSAPRVGFTPHHLKRHQAGSSRRQKQHDSGDLPDSQLQDTDLERVLDNK
jgi:serine/threonine protein kinase